MQIRTGSYTYSLENIDLKGSSADYGIDRMQFEHIFHFHYEEIRNYIYYKSGRIDEAEDIAQEADST